MSLTAPSSARPDPTNAFGPEPPAEDDRQAPAAIAALERARAAHPAGRAHPLPRTHGTLVGPRGVPTAPPALRFPNADDVAELGAATHPLSLSLLMTTTPASRMTEADRVQLVALARDAHRRLEEESDRRGAATVRAGLAAAVARAEDGPTDRGLAILVSPGGAHLHHLRVRPRDRVVLDPTFATRDLVRSSAEDPPFLLLAIDGRAARLFHYDQRYSRPVLGHDFPMLRPEPGGRERVGAVDRSRRERARAFLREVDQRLSARLREHALPVVLIGSDRTVAEYLEVGRGRRIAAIVRSGATHQPLFALEEMGRTALREHVSDRVAAALDTAHVRLRQGRAVTGLTDAWQAMLHGEPELVLVERSYAAAMRVTEDGFALAEDPEEPGVLDDAVDELIEAALGRGAEVICVPDAALQHHGRLVLVMRGRVQTW
jgi:hypothetical protein